MAEAQQHVKSRFSMSDDSTLIKFYASMELVTHGVGQGKHGRVVQKGKSI